MAPSALLCADHRPGQQRPHKHRRRHRARLRAGRRQLIRLADRVVYSRPVMLWLQPAGIGAIGVGWLGWHVVMALAERH